MRRIGIFIEILIVLLALEISASAAPEFYGYRDCIVLKNRVCRAVVTGERGCRLLEFSFQGENPIFAYSKPADRYWFSPTGGRMDIGPELPVPKHPSVWGGTWTGKRTSPLSMVWKSPEDPAAPFEVTREFSLDERLPKLTIRQTVRNRLTKPLVLHHWGRGMFRPGGTVIVPLLPKGVRRFPRGFAQYGWKPDFWNLDLDPKDPAVTEQDGLLLVSPRPKHPKNTFECGRPWAAYLLPGGDRLLVMSFAISPRRTSGELGGGNFIIFYNEQFCELEPIGPRESVAPGGMFHFTERWELFNVRRSWREILEKRPVVETDHFPDKTLPETTE